MMRPRLRSTPRPWLAALALMTLVPACATQLSPTPPPTTSPILPSSTPRPTATTAGRTYLPHIVAQALPTPPAPFASPLSTPAPTPTATPIPTPTPTPLPPDPLLGINVADTSDVSLLRHLGFGWLQVFLPPTAPVQPFKLLYRISLGDAVSGRDEDIAQFGRVVEGVVRDHGSNIDAYAIGNEPNLSREWGGAPPDPELYARLLRLAYEKIKALDPDALVISAGIAPTGGDGPGFMDDLAFARRMLAAGAANAFDAYGFHPYGFAFPPEQDSSQATGHSGLAFRRAEVHRRLMEEYGAGHKQMWATEYGWLLNPADEGVTCDWPDANWQKVNREQQADYVLGAYRFARANWPWMGPMFVWNYDFSRSPLYPDSCEPMKWYSIIDAQGRPRLIAERLATRLER
jgi:hypothetical protein